VLQVPWSEISETCSRPGSQPLDGVGFLEHGCIPVHFVIPNPLQRRQYTRLCTLSFRIRLSGANLCGPALCHSESALAMRNLLARLIVSGNAACLATLATWDSRSDRNGFVSGYAFRPPATDAPCRPAPIGRNPHCTLLHSASHQAPPAHGEGAFKSYSRFRGLNILETCSRPRFARGHEPERSGRGWQPIPF